MLGDGVCSSIRTIEVPAVDYERQQDCCMLLYMIRGVHVVDIRSRWSRVLRLLWLPHHTKSKEFERFCRRHP